MLKEDILFIWKYVNIMKYWNMKNGIYKHQPEPTIEAQESTILKNFSVKTDRKRAIDKIYWLRSLKEKHAF